MKYIAEIALALKELEIYMPESLKLLTVGYDFDCHLIATWLRDIHKLDVYPEKHCNSRDSTLEWFPNIMTLNHVINGSFYNALLGRCNAEATFEVAFELGILKAIKRLINTANPNYQNEIS